LFGRCRLFLRSKTASNSIAPDEHLPASTEPYEDAGRYSILERPAFGDARRLTAALIFFYFATLKRRCSRLPLIARVENPCNFRG
jgi:hypothetical protein